MKAVSDLLLAQRLSQNIEITIIFELFNYTLQSLMQNVPQRYSNANKCTQKWMNE